MNHINYSSIELEFESNSTENDFGFVLHGVWG